MGRAKRKKVTCEHCGEDCQIFNHRERPLVWECPHCHQSNTIDD